MTAGLKPPPFAGEPDGVARRVRARASTAARPVVYTPPIWALVMLVIRWLPRFVMRRVGVLTRCRSRPRILRCRRCLLPAPLAPLVRARRPLPLHGRTSCTGASTCSGVRCEVCITYNGLSQCRTVDGEREEDVHLAAVNNVCAYLANGVTDNMACMRTPPTQGASAGRWTDAPAHASPDREHLDRLR